MYLLIPIVAWLVWLTVRVRIERRAARAYQVASNQRHNDLKSIIRELQIQLGWDDSRARTMHLDPKVLDKWRKETGPR